MSEPSEKSIQLSAGQYERMRAEAESHAPEECCGLVAGTGRRAVKVYPVTNALHSPSRFLMDAHEQVKAFLEIEQEGWELLAIYHSHPRGPQHPSQTDIKEFYYPEVIYLVWSRQTDAWECRGYLIEGGNYIEVEVDTQAE